MSLTPTTRHNIRSGYRQMRLASTRDKVEHTRRVLRDIENELQPPIFAPAKSDQDTLETVRKLVRRAGQRDLGPAYGLLEDTLARIEHVLEAPSSAAEKIDALWTLLDDDELNELLAQEAAR